MNGIAIASIKYKILLKNANGELIEVVVDDFNDFPVSNYQELIQEITIRKSKNTDLQLKDLINFEIVVIEDD